MFYSSQAVTFEGGQSKLSTVSGGADLRGAGLASGHQAHHSPCGRLHSVTAASASSPLHKQQLFIPPAGCWASFTLNSAFDRAFLFVCQCAHPYVCQSNYVQLKLGLIIQQGRRVASSQRLTGDSRGHRNPSDANALAQTHHGKRVWWKHSLTRQRHNGGKMMTSQWGGESLSQQTHTQRHTHTHTQSLSLLNRLAPQVQRQLNSGIRESRQSIHLV